MRILFVRHAALPALLLPLIAAAQTADEQTMMMTAAPTTVPELSTPTVISVVNEDEMRQATPRVDLSELLGAVLGLQVQNRQNYTQDLQLSIRRFGSRSTYGVCKLRIYTDSIPAIVSDGQGQTSNIDIGSVDTIEVLRGPFSVLYGNSSGEVINVTSWTGTQPPTMEASSYYGNFGTWYHGMRAVGTVDDGGHAGDVDYTISTNRFTTHGYCDHSGARKNLANTRLGVRINDISKLTLLLDSVDIKANDAGDLTADEWYDNPRRSPRGDQYSTHRNAWQTQAGLRYERQLSAQDDLGVMMYTGERETTQFQSIPRAPQLKPGHAGGAIDLIRHYRGIGTRLTHRGEPLVPVTLTAGLDYENMSERRKGYKNFVMVNGAPQYSEQGVLCRNERSLMWNVDPYPQTRWQLTDKLLLDTRVYYSSVWFDSNDYYTTPSNGDNSDDASYHKWLPTGLLKYALTDAWDIYLFAGRGFRTSTVSELSCRSDNQSGLDFGLESPISSIAEIGNKTRLGNGLFAAAPFQTNIDNEIVVDSNSDRRIGYKNAGKAHRQGVELGSDRQLGKSWRLKAARTWPDATYRTNVYDDASCNGNRIPGIARNMSYASFSCRSEQGWYAGSGVHYMSDIMADGENTARAPSWTVIGLITGYKWSYDRMDMDLSGRIDNLFDWEYVGSVIINEFNGRYYKPVPGRNYGISLDLARYFG